MPELAKTLFVDFLIKVNPKASRAWMRDQLALEFGEKIEVEISTWWDYFGISPTASWGEVRQAYQACWNALDREGASTQDREILGFYFDLARSFLK